MTEPRRPVIAGNWKMNCLLDAGLDLAQAVEDGAGGRDCEIVICPPHVLLHPVNVALEDNLLGLGAQDCHVAEKGAHTGDVSAAMLADAGCGYVIVGHSERRVDHGESDDLVRAKAESVFAQELVAIICIGETEAERDDGRTEAVLAKQLDGSVPAGSNAANTIIAYEPVWAIGTGKTPTADEAQNVHSFIRRYLAEKLGDDIASGMRILYGGSMKPSNAAELLAQADIDGGLIGGASLNAGDFHGIVECLPG
ncbi:triose-phosphate isomerase [Aestuariispira insulae]|uniref:Triosephosphate isomerase n=1 Tax=Aestuariispira insulae TaxID=1461337 RepID=A0A3D9HUT4_9PROT|nr:triose-phosphate isomerase [Aestuariispira insulae]RED53274.1 triosephosphate isomerase [Aestuariispira insulae]